MPIDSVWRENSANRSGGLTQLRDRVVSGAPLLIGYNVNSLALLAPATPEEAAGASTSAVQKTCAPYPIEPPSRPVPAREAMPRSNG
jgi:hypothetical protein